MKYTFFYDETEHSRKINLRTINVENYYDNFITSIVGWKLDHNELIENRYLSFESKYEDRKKNGELKSQTMKTKDFKFGFASLNNNRIGFYEDLLSLYDEKIIIYFSVFSKLEYLINQLFLNYHNSIFVDADLMKYSIIKAINIYRPQKVLKSMYEEPEIFIQELKKFLRDRINKNQANITLKQEENNTFETLLKLLEDVEPLKTINWSYFASFDGFIKLMTQMDINDYQLIIDREGNESHTLNSAKAMGIDKVFEKNSKDYVGIRMADMFVGLIAHLMKSLNKSLTNNYKNGKIVKTQLSASWFNINDRQLNLYKKLYKIVCENNNYWYKSYSGMYTDDVVALVSLLQFMNSYSNAENLLQNGVKNLADNYNYFVCTKIKERYEIIHNKLPIDFISNDNKDYFEYPQSTGL